MTVTHALSGRRRPARATLPPTCRGRSSVAATQRGRRPGSRRRQDPTLWGPEAEEEAVEAARLGRRCPTPRAPLRRPRSRRCATSCAAEGSTASCSAAWAARRSRPEVISAHRRASPLVVARHAPTPTRCAPRSPTDLDRTVVVVSSKSGGTVETDSQRRAFEQAFARRRHRRRPTRIVVVTDPARRWSSAPREAGYRGVPRRPERRRPLLGADRVRPGARRPGRRRRRRAARRGRRGAPTLAADDADNPALRARRRARRHRRRWRGQARASSTPARGIVGFGDWAEQLIAESTGKDGTGVLPVVVEGPTPPSSRRPAHDVVVVGAAGRRAGDDRRAHAARRPSRRRGPLGAQFLLWEYATAVAGRLLGINPFDQPDVESAKIAARGLLDDAARARAPPRSSTAAIEVRGDRRACSTASDDRRRRASTRCSAQLADRRLPRGDGLPRPDRATRALAGVRRAAGAAHRAAGRPSAGARGSCTPPASTTRAARRPACSSRSPATADRGPGGPRPAVHASASSSPRRRAGDAQVLADHGRPGAAAAPDRPRSGLEPSLLDAAAWQDVTAMTARMPDADDASPTATRCATRRTGGCRGSPARAGW